MSIKIHNGYRLTANTDPFAFFKHVRTRMVTVRETLDATELMDRATTSIDLADRKGEERASNPLYKAWEQFADEQRKMNPAHRGHDPHRFQVSFAHDTPSNRIMCLLFSQRREFETAWESLAEVEPYGYWDNTDPEEDITPLEWTQRKAAWDRIMPNGCPPVESMLTFSLYGTPDKPMWDLAASLRPQESDPERRASTTELLRAVAPSKAKRARRLAIDLLAQETTNREDQKLGRSGANSDNLVMTVIHLVHDMSNHAPDYQPVLDACEAALNDDVTDYILNSTTPTETSPTGPWAQPAPINLDQVHAAIATHLDEKQSAL